MSTKENTRESLAKQPNAAFNKNEEYLNQYPGRETDTENEDAGADEDDDEVRKAQNAEADEYPEDEEASEGMEDEKPELDKEDLKEK